MIQVTPKDELPVSNLNLDDKSFRKFDPSKTPGLGYEGFIDVKEGLVVRAVKGKVEELVYFAGAADQTRCPAYYENPEDLVQVSGIGCAMAFDQYGDIGFADEKARLDNFAIQLLNDENSKGHIFVYAGRKATVAEAQIRANRALNYLITIRKLDPGRVTAVDGGHQEELAVQLYIFPAGADPPSPMPTIDPSQVEIIYEKIRRPAKKNR
jgi:hypothetical protein